MSTTVDLLAALQDSVNKAREARGEDPLTNPVPVEDIRTTRPSYDDGPEDPRIERAEYERDFPEDPGQDIW